MVKKKNTTKTIIREVEKEKKPMKIRDEFYSLPPETLTIIEKAIKTLNTYTDEYKMPTTLGKPKSGASSEAVLAMDSCAIHNVSAFKQEWASMAVPRFIGYPMLSAIAQDPLIRAGIETIADDMTRKFIEIISIGDNDVSEKISIIEQELKRYKVSSIFNHAQSLNGFMGGCLVYIDVGDIDDETKRTPLHLDPTTFKVGSLKGFKVIEPINVYPGIYDTLNPTSDNFYNPETWYILGKEYHKSRFLYFSQNDLPIIIKPLYNFFGLSLSQQVLEYVHNFTENRRSAQRLLNKFSLLIWKTNMSGFLSGDDCDNMINRVKFFNRQRSNDGTALIDYDTEDMVQLNTPLAGVTDIVSMSLDLAPLILGIPKDQYFGDVPKGLNANNEGTRRIYYDKIDSLKHKIFENPCEKVIKILQLNSFGNIDDDITFKFPPLWEMDAMQVATINKMEAETDAIFISAGITSQEEARNRLSHDMDSGYSGIDVDDVPENMNDLFGTSDPLVRENEEFELLDREANV